MANVISITDWREALERAKGSDEIPLHTPIYRYSIEVKAISQNGITRVLTQEYAGHSVFDAVEQAALDWKTIFIFGDGDKLTDITTMHTLEVKVELL